MRVSEYLFGRNRFLVEPKVFSPGFTDLMAVNTTAGHFGAIVQRRRVLFFQLDEILRFGDLGFLSGLGD